MGKLSDRRDRTRKFSVHHTTNRQEQRVKPQTKSLCALWGAGKKKGETAPRRISRPGKGLTEVFLRGTKTQGARKRTHRTESKSQRKKALAEKNIASRRSPKQTKKRRVAKKGRLHLKGGPCYQRNIKKGKGKRAGKLDMRKGEKGQTKKNRSPERKKMSRKHRSSSAGGGKRGSLD